jgi:hypothetical protein
MPIVRTTSSDPHVPIPATSSTPPYLRSDRAVARENRALDRGQRLFLKACHSMKPKNENCRIEAIVTAALAPTTLNATVAGISTISDEAAVATFAMVKLRMSASPCRT